MTTKFTPGPWHVSAISQHDGSVSIAKDRFVVCLVTNAASIFDVVQGHTPEAQFANARLIASAPELLEALEIMIVGACAVGVPHAGERKVLQDAVDHARATINKATGEQT